MNDNVYIEQVKPYCDNVTPSGGLSESYQNSAMSAPVMAYVFRDVDDNIFRVYEPIRNNDVSRKGFAYSDSIDLFPFDSVDCFGNAISDLKLENIASDVKIQGSNLQTMIIDGGGFAGLQIINETRKGNYGIQCAQDKEIIVGGVNFILKGNNAPVGDSDFSASYINAIGANSTISGNFFAPGSAIEANGFSMASFKGNSLMPTTKIILSTSNLSSCNTNAFISPVINVHGDAEISDSQFNQECFVFLVNPITSSQIGAFSSIDTTDGGLDGCDVGSNCAIAPATDQTGKNFARINGTTYLLGVTAGNVTATAV